MATRLILVLCFLWFVLVTGLQLLTGNARNDGAMLGIAVAPLAVTWVIRMIGAYVLYGRFWIPPLT